MSVNPAKREDNLSNPIYRGNPLNDPQFQQQQGYNNYDLTNGQMCSPRFGECTPTTVFETVPGDRHVLHGNSLTILNQIDANLISEINQYQDYFYCPLRVLMPNNYEKLIPNPTKGEDLPWKALPMVPLWSVIFQFLQYDDEIDIIWRDRILDDEYNNVFPSLSYDVVGDVIRNYDNDPTSRMHLRLMINQLLYIAYTLSRGQLLDYLGYSVELSTFTPSTLESRFQTLIDNFFNALIPVDSQDYVNGIALKSYRLPLNQNSWDLTVAPEMVYEVRSMAEFDLSQYRKVLYDSLENGLFLDIQFDHVSQDLATSFDDLYSSIYYYVRDNGFVQIPSEEEAEPFTGAFLNISRCLAYQLSIAEYQTNDSVDNVFNSELFMQNLRAVMFPSNRNSISTREGVSIEPTFDYNGVPTEYDYITTGAVEYSMFTLIEGQYARIQNWLSLLFFLRRSLRYGDYYSTARPNMLAVGQLGINVESGVVSPIDITQNLLMQRYLNAANYTGARFLNYMTSMFGVKPSDVPPHPVFLSHRKIPMQRNISTNTANNQGFQTTNLLGKSDDNAMDIFIDDFGIVLGVCSFDALPVYTAGIDRNFYLSDRFEYFNSMLQNVGDQAIQLRELSGNPVDDNVFGYQMRYANYKMAVTRAHGAFVNALPHYVMRYPLASYLETNVSDYELSLKINPDFIRDKPAYFDQFFKQRTGLSPAEYYHFIVSVMNQHFAARKMQYQPPVLF